MNENFKVKKINFFQWIKRLNNLYFNSLITDANKRKVNGRSQKKLKNRYSLS